MVYASLSAQYNDFLDRIKTLPVEMWDNAANAISEQPIKHFFNQFYPMSATLAQMTRKQMLQKKDAEDDLYLSVFERQMQYLASQSGEKITTITATSKERILAVIREVISEGNENGYGIDKLRDNLFSEVGKNLRGNGRARAKAIAQTEMISASNQASTYAAESTGLEYRKFWSTSHLQGIRPTHIMAEQDSIQRGGLKPNELFANGLKYPGDPSGPAEEVINCRCCILHEIV
jgi:hypothetical protein